MFVRYLDDCQINVDAVGEIRNTLGEDEKFVLIIIGTPERRKPLS